jgi:ABC-type uncharacterized transport system fused permease/ATPase subunit
MQLYKRVLKSIGWRTLLVGVIPLMLVLVVEIITTSMIPYARKIVIDALTNKDWDWFLLASFIALGNMILLTGSQGMKDWLGQKVSFIVRNKMINLVGSDYRSSSSDIKSDNPWSRLNDDSRTATEGAIKVTVECLISFSIVVGLIFTIIKWPVLLIGAIIYSAIAICLALLFRRPMINKNYALRAAESDHRFMLTEYFMRQREHKDAGILTDLRLRYEAFIGISRNYKLFNALQSAIMYTVPFFIMAPGYFAGELTLGDIMQGTVTFDLLVINAAIWVQLYPQITEAQTAYIRLNELDEELQESA